MTRWIEATHKYPLLRSAARKMAWELGGHANLVGSALHSETRPRDVDVRIVLGDEVFAKRFGISPEDWQWQARTCHWTAARWAWHRQTEAYQVMLATACGERTVDLGIIPDMLWQAIYEKAPHESWGAWADYVSASVPRVSDPTNLINLDLDLLWSGGPAPSREKAIEAIYTQLGQRIREAREATGLSQKDLAYLITVERTSITNIESGRQHPPLHVIYDIARALTVPIYSLLPVGEG